MAVTLAAILTATLAATSPSRAARVGGDLLGSSAFAEADDTLSTPIQLVRWTGQFRQTGPSVPVPIACLEGLCDDFGLAVELPAGIWSRAGGVQIGVRASRGAVHIYVYDADGELVAQSASETVGNAFGDIVLGYDNSVIVPQAANGLYRVVVVSPSPLHADQSLELVSYEGIAEVEFFPTVQPVRDLLPNLVPFPTRNVRIPNGTGSGLVLIGDDEEGFQAGGCLLEEMVEEGARKCLRFDNIFANIGQGAYEAEVRHQPDGSSQVWQRVFHSDGGHHDRLAGDAEFHETHGHFHVTNLALNRLWRSNEVGDKLGSAPVVPEGSKLGFCHGDTDNEWFGRKGDAARTYTDGSGCFGLGAVPPTSSQGPFGISVGWADTYAYGIAGQYIEITGVSDGYYLLESEVNPLHTVVESDTSDNSIFVLIRICGDEAELVGKENRCSP